MRPPPSIPSRRAAAAALALTVLLGGCVHAVNYEHPSQPRYAGLPRISAEPSTDGDALVVGTFNVRYGIEVERALQVIARDPQLGASDVVLLILPHRSFIGDTQRIATVATLDVAGRDVRVYSVHIATPVNQTFPERVDQMRTVLEDAAGHEHVIIGGDLNSVGLAELGLDFGFDWPTREGPRTAWFGRIDHILHRGFDTPGQDGVGTVLDDGDASDHKPVWARAVFSDS